VRDLAEKAAGYGIPAHIVDGNDVVACYEVMKQAADYARRGGGAVLIEAKTYRRKGHAEHDDQRYVAAGEIEWWEKNNDPIDRYERYLLDCNLATKEKPEGEQAAYGVFDNNIVPPAFRPKVLEG
jgi:TPP-dependent pyruvate/acetoin dehydrogenase alpha subunit